MIVLVMSRKPLEKWEAMHEREARRATSVPSNASGGNCNAKLRLLKTSDPIGGIEIAAKKPRPLIALVDPKPLTRLSITNTLAATFPEHAITAASTCEEVLEILGGRIGAPDLVVVYTRSAGLATPSVRSALELLRVRLPDARAVVLSDRDDIEEVDQALAYGGAGLHPDIGRMRSRNRCAQAYQCGWNLCPGGCAALGNNEAGQQHGG